MTQKDPTNHLGLNDGRWHEVQPHHAGLSSPDYEFAWQGNRRLVRDVAASHARLGKTYIGSVYGVEPEGALK